MRNHLCDGWDLLVLCHPPCTRLCNSGVRWLHEPPKNAPRDASDEERAAWPTMSREERLESMWRQLDEGAALFSDCWQAPIPRVAVENPIMNPYARERLPEDLPKPQIVQPWWFGEPFFKGTGFYLRNLPRLSPTNKLTPPTAKGDPDRHKKWSAVHRAPPGPDRWKIRSRTFEGVANACAIQWGDYAAHDEAALAA